MTWKVLLGIKVREKAYKKMKPTIVRRKDEEVDKNFENPQEAAINKLVAEEIDLEGNRKWWNCKGKTIN